MPYYPPPAPPSATYVTLSSDAGLQNERTLTGTTNQITVTDNGAGSTVVLSLPQDIHTGADLVVNSLGLSTNGTITATGAQGWGVVVTSDTAGNGGQNFFTRQRTSGAPAILSGDALGAFSFRGHDGTSQTGSKAFLSATAAANWSGTSTPTLIDFRTTPTGSTTLTRGMTLTDRGNLLINSSSSAQPSTGTMGLFFGDGTAPATMASNTAGVYADDLSGTVVMRGIWEDGTVGTLGLVVTKGTTGDPTGHEGLFCINTFDNTFKVYADGGWRTIASGW